LNKDYSIFIKQHQKIIIIKHLKTVNLFLLELEFSLLEFSWC
jgi:hypothetical protein